MIYYNNLSAFTEVHYGNTNIDEVYFGNNKVWPEGPVPFEGKFRLTLSDSSTVSAACDSTSAVTSGEISSYKNSVISAEIGDCVTNIYWGTFYNCSSLTSATIGNSVTTIGDRTFYNCYSLTSIGIPDNVTSIGGSAFEKCSGLTSVDIGSGVTSIGTQAFYSCRSLTSVTIPDSVTSIGTAAFYKCNGLTSVTCFATTPPTFGSLAFNETNNCPIYVPSESVNTYKTTYGWSNYASRIQAIP